MPELFIRELKLPEEALEIPALERAIWNDPGESIRPGTLIALVHEGALLAGAYAREEGSERPRLVGFIFGFPTSRPTDHHSHMAGVLPAYRDMGVGFLLKRYQRDWALSRGYERVVWTFDPLRAANAHFNLQKLGATFDRYIPNCYGPMGGINAGAPSDRVYATWELRSPRVLERLYAPPPPPKTEGLPLANRVEGEVPLEARLELSENRIMVQIPEDWGAILQADPALALAWREHSRLVFGHYLARGYRAVGFARKPNCYVLERRHAQPCEPAPPTEAEGGAF
ncbi:MAG: GNAT family N-acetyltransferase [Meiothermus sp.]|uniref:GNAT family N-acetyltransferase n=1 Tax=Meiothermus sp. TaxID=1955249 RepID=UPI0026276E9E|nr:GNAT family N-acetyltransferase [Meiothermus sp.]MCS7058228.1 GNAT family N-acetyltransferase [Meiothermus sp.]MCX7739488.1 GNAT family N-acetyltransferase [Meiothermus sp.]MDW8481339.1 GNAT family N-acetyltransferase [Meiothermus sp.]